MVGNSRICEVVYRLCNLNMWQISTILYPLTNQEVNHGQGNSLLESVFRRRQWHPTPVFLPGESQGWESLVGCHLWGHTESDTTEATLAAAAESVYLRSVVMGGLRHSTLHMK